MYAYQKIITAYRMLYKFQLTAEKFNSVKSVQKKTEAFVIVKEPRHCKVAIYNQTVDQNNEI